MAFGRFIESSLCLFVFVAGLFVAVPLRLLEERTGKTCLLFGQVDYLEKNVTGGNSHYCSLGFYSSVVDLALASFLICLRWCCLMKTEKRSLIYGSLISFVLATLGWINCMARGVFMITGINEWCTSIKKTGISSCEKAVTSWKWQEFSPQPLDASKANDYFLMIEVSSYVAIVLWFLVAFMSGTQMRKAIYHILDAQGLYREQQIQTSRPMDMYEGPPVYVNQAQDPGVFMYDEDHYEDDFDPRIDYGKVTHL